jgi:hypothetical protein
MAEIWPVNHQPADKVLVTELARRFARLGLDSSYAATFRLSVQAMLALSDDDILIMAQRVKDGISATTSGKD